MYVYWMGACVAQFLKQLTVDKKPIKRINLDDIEDDAEEEVCHTFTLLCLDLNLL
jgi:hypothetical protein